MFEKLRRQCVIETLCSTSATHFVAKNNAFVQLAYAQIEKTFVFAAHGLAIQATRLVC